MSQLGFASLDYAAKKKRTKREVFPAEMDRVVPWNRLEAVIAPHYPKANPSGGGRRPFPLAVMLRVYCLQQWYQLSDPGAEEALYGHPVDALVRGPSNLAATPSPTRRPFSTSAICSSATI